MGQLQKYSYYNLIRWDKGGNIKCFVKSASRFHVEGDNEDYIMHLKLEGHYSIPDINNLIAVLEPILTTNEKTFVVLTSRKNPPLTTAREDEHVFSFCCKFKHFNTLFTAINKNDIASTDLLFELLDQIGESHSPFESILIKQFPIEQSVSAIPYPCDVIIPYRGEGSYLKTLLHFLAHIGNITALVGIDQDITQEVKTIEEINTNVEFYNFEPTPVGPYVIRNWLIDQGKNDFIFFQDSDDIPCVDRFATLTRYMQENNCQLCGSHELRLDYFTRSVRAVRFPLDVKEALKVGPHFPLLHPTSAITRKAFYKCGKLSEERTFGNDTKFLLKSYFILKDINNIDEFLYIRKVHPGSLTTSPDTMLGSPIRQKLLFSWNTDFEKIKSGTLQLENSSLKYEESKLSYKVRKLVVPPEYLPNN